MLNNTNYQTIALVRLENRATPDGRGNVYFRMKDGRGHARMTMAEWEEVREAALSKLRASARRLNITMLRVIATLVAFLIFNGFAGELLRLGPPWLGSAIVLGLLFGAPLLATIRHVRENARVLDEVARRLSRHPRGKPPPTPVRKASNVLDALAAFAMLPVALQVAGWLNPRAFRNTPWSGTTFDILGALGLAVICVALVVRAGRSRAARRASD
jgi:hypothetical protein